ncbi:hypothetical protein BJ875DRAFT_117143 [Amylocarpus encephaloides]|uniref:Uncharacterized protein n=1 Tax=Amylocarpus encephaloides TaxID=45428 RepID=A0A9P8C3Y8_9HELO|nr:hypothetical protein BJ875DRAFT_117143 [Amylocarpus encephaloides]
MAEATEAKLDPSELPPSLPPESDKSEEAQQTRKEKFLAKAQECITKAESAQVAEKEACERAEKLSDPKEKQKLLEEATKQDKLAKSLLTTASRLQSGVWQGGLAGAGVGAGIGTGVGTVVGSIVGGVIAIPTTGLGALAGAGTGAIHGPWVKIPGQEKEKEKEAEQQQGDIEAKGEEIKT